MEKLPFTSVYIRLQDTFQVFSAGCSPPISAYVVACRQEIFQQRPRRLWSITLTPNTHQWNEPTSRTSHIYIHDILPSWAQSLPGQTLPEKVCKHIQFRFAEHLRGAKSSEQPLQANNPSCDKEKELLTKNPRTFAQRPDRCPATPASAFFPTATFGATASGAREIGFASAAGRAS